MIFVLTVFVLFVCCLLAAVLAFAKAYKHLKNANSLFSQDAELLRIIGNYNYELNDLEKALEDVLHNKIYNKGEN